MKIAIDCRSLRKKPTGVPNLLINFINTLAGQQKDWQIILLSNEPFDNEVNQRLHRFDHVAVIISPLPILKSIAILWYMVKLPWMLKRLDVNLFFTPIPNLPIWLPNHVQTLVEVNDMVYKYYSKTMSWGNWGINLFLHDRSIRKADFIWAISEYTRQEIEKLYPLRKSKEILVGVSVDKQIFRPEQLTETEKIRLRETYAISDSTLLFVGTLEPRKNLQFLISLMPELALLGFTLLIIGANGWGNALGNLTPEIREKVKFSGFVPNEDLVRIYQLVSVFVSTSLNEGFGLPQLEAMCCGCPVVSAHNSAMIEVVEGAGETVKGWEAGDWISTIKKVANNREYYITRGYQRASTYEWSKIISQAVHYLQPGSTKPKPDR